MSAAGFDLSRLALALLRPDALAAGHGAAILADLEARHGAVPVALRVLTLDASVVDALYRRQEKIPRDSLWLHHEVYASAPSAAVLLAGERPGLTRELFAGKGASAVLESAAADCLRTRFGRAGSFHAVLHAPADEAALAAEAALFFPADVLTGAAAATPLPRGWVSDLVGLEPHPGRLVLEAVVLVKLRIAAALGLRLGEGAVSELRAATATAARELEGAGYLAQRERFRAFAAVERPLLERALATERARVAAPAGGAAGRAEEWRRLRAAVGPATLLYCSWFLSGHERWLGDGGERIFAALSDHDVPLSPHGRTLLAAALREDLP